MLDLTDLRAFNRIAELGSISAAARALGSPKSSVSRALLRLEETLGTVLVERSTRHLRLTDAGRLLQRHAPQILDDVEEAASAVGDLLGKASGVLRVNVPFSFAVGPLAGMLPRFTKDHPEVRLVLNLDNRPIDLTTDELDVAIRIGPQPDSELIRKRITTFALWLCASPEYLAAHGSPKTVADLPAHRLLTIVDRRTTWHFRTSSGKSHAIEIAPGLVIPEPTVIKTMLLAGAGLGLLPDFYARDAIAAGTLVHVLPAHHATPVEAHALYPSHRSRSVKVRAFIEGLIAHLAPPT